MLRHTDRTMHRFVRFLVPALVALLLPFATEARESVRIVASDSGAVVVLTRLASAVQRDLRSGMADASVMRSTVTFGRPAADYARRFYLIVPPHARLSARFVRTSFRVVPAALSDRLPHLESGVSITPIGISAGQHIAEIDVQPLTSRGMLSQATVLDSVVIDIRFEGGKLHSHVPDESPERPSISVLNEGFCSMDRHRALDTKSVSAIPAKQERASAMLGMQTSSNVRRSIRVASTRDGVARINSSDLLSIMPEWRGASVSALRLTYRGEEQRLFIPSRYVVIDDSTEIYYYGRRASGDTTWYSPFTRECAMYLTVDSSSPAKRYARRAESAGGATVSVIDIDRHVEEEHDYNQSYFYDDPFNAFFVTETVPGEKWHWASFDRRTPFDTDVPIVPSMQPDDSLRVSVLYNAVNNIRDAKPDKRVQCYVYGRLVYDETFDSTLERSVRVSVGAQEGFGGVMNVRAVSLGANTTVPNYSEKQILDYITVQGRVQSYAWRGALEGRTQQGAAANLRVRKLHSKRAVLMDTLNGEARDVTATSGVTLIAGARAGSTPVYTHTRNDSVIARGTDARTHVRSFVPPEFEDGAEWSGPSNAPDLLTFLKSVPTNGCIVLTANDAENFSSEVRAWLQAQGCTRIVDRGSKGCYGVILQKEAGVLDEASTDSSLTLGCFLPAISGTSFEALVPLRAGRNEVSVNSADSIENARLSDDSLPSLRADSSEAEYLIVTHEVFTDQARRLAEYRSARGVRVRVVDVENVYRDFGEGQKSPHAIKSFLRFAYDSWRGKRLRHVLLFGDASWDGREIPPYGKKKDFIPTYGKPVSDIWYTLLDGADTLPDVNLGRLPVETKDQARSLVDKIIAYDTLQPDQWWKHFVFVSGGDGEFEQEDFRDISIAGLVPFVLSEDEDMKPYTMCGDTTIITTLSTTKNPTYSTSGELNTQINGDGTVWVNYIGHGAPTITEISGWDTTSVKNYDRPFVLSTLACQNAAFAERDVSCIDEDFLLARRRGAIAAIGSTGYGVPLVQQRVMQDMFAEMGRGKARTLGEIFTRAEALLSRYPGNIFRGVFFQCCLLGDPLTRIPFDTVIRPVILPNSVTVVDSEGSVYVTEDKDSAFVRFRLFNEGVSSDDSVSIALIRRFRSTVDTAWYVVPSICNTNDILIPLFTRSQAGDHALRIEIDPFNALRRKVNRDSAVELTFRVYSPQPLPIEPLHGWDVAATRSVFRFTFSDPERLKDSVQFFIRSRDSVVVEQAFGDEKNVLVSATHIEWRPDATLPVGRELTFAVRSKSRQTGDTSAWLFVPFHVRDTVSSAVNLRSVVQTDAGSYRTEGLRLDTTQTPQAFVMNRLIPFNLRSTIGRMYYDSLGVLRYDIVQGYEIRIDNVTYGDNMFQRGVNVRTVNRYTGAVNAVRNFDTFYDADTCDTCFNGSGRTLNRFLRTSVSDSEYVLIALCGASYGDVYTRRDLDTFKMRLTELGSKSAGLLKDPRSFVFVGSRDTVSIKAREIVNTDTTGPYTEADTVILSGTLRISPITASMTTPLFGPAKSWKSLTIEGDVDDSLAVITMTVLGFHTPFSTPDTLFTAKGSRISLDSVNSKEYPYVKAVARMVRSSMYGDVIIRGVAADMEPLPEFAVIPNSLRVQPDSVLRGDTIVTSASYRRISPRGFADSILVELTVTPLQGAGEARALGFPASRPALDADVLVADTSSTLRYSTRSHSRFILDPGNAVPELYRFNNSLETENVVSNDELAPSVVLFIDSVEAYEGMPVSQKPRVEAYMTDNSRMPIIQSSNLTARVNLVPIDTGVTSGFRFWGSDEVGSVAWTSEYARAAIAFTPHLEFGTNTIRLRARDYFGNETVRTVGVRVSRDVATDSVTVAPNPFSENATIRFDLRSPILTQTIHLQVYDLRGQLVRSIRRPARIGMNAITIDDRDDNGSLLLQGSYYYRLFVGDEVNLDMRTGVIILVR